MHRKQPIAVAVYNNIFPHPRPEDPASFSMHLSKNLVGEVRIETATFYGSLDTIEARYPGLNYSHPPHRKRLGRFPHHARLFQAFDELGLTSSEISGFCRWEGTLWARERYERDEGFKVIDTYGQEIKPWVDLRDRKKKEKYGINVKTDIEVQILEAETHAAEHVVEEDEPMQEGEDAEESEEELESVGFELNRRIQENTVGGGSGRPVPDAEWEQYLKDQQELREQRERAQQDTRYSRTAPILPPLRINSLPPHLQSQMRAPNVH